MLSLLIYYYCYYYDYYYFLFLLLYLFICISPAVKPFIKFSFFICQFKLVLTIISIVGWSFLSAMR